MGRARIGLSAIWGCLLAAGIGLSSTPVLGIGQQASLDLRFQAADRFVIGARNDDRLGTVMAVGDFDGDGSEDLALGAPHANHPLTGRARNGLAYVLFGPIAPGTAPYDLLALEQGPPGEALQLMGADEEDWLGFSLSLGDLNGDGVDDLAVGVPLADGPDNALDWQGEVLIFWGRPAWRTVSRIEPASADLVLYGQDFFDRLGIGLAIGDLNADGYGDLVASAPFGQDNNRELANRVYLFFGPDLQRCRLIENVDFDSYSSGNNNNLAVGDVNGDNVADLVLGSARGDAFAPAGRAGMVYVLFGKRSLSAATEALDFSKREEFQLLCKADDSYDYLGQAVAVAEAGPQMPPWMAISAPGGDYHERGWGSSGVVYLVAGGAWLATGTDLPLPGTTAIAIYGGDDYQQAGASLTFGNVDGDSLPDLLIGAPFAEGPPRHDDRRVGRVYCLYGTTLLGGGTEPLNLREDYDLVIYGDRKYDEFGYALAAAALLVDATPGEGDNIIASAWTGDGLPERGRGNTGEVYLFADRNPGLGASGDLNGDGQTDFRDAFLLSLPEHRQPTKTGLSQVQTPQTPVLLFLKEWRNR